MTSEGRSPSRSEFPPYPVAELRADLNHLLQPLIGMDRLHARDTDDEAERTRLERRVERLRLALALVDVATGDIPRQDFDEVMAMRGRTGSGTFEALRAETAPARVQS